jgi:hypothetical protein
LNIILDKYKLAAKMNNTKDKLRKIKVDALYGKKKHFNSADRKEKNHYRIGVPLVVINILTGSILFYVITDGATNWGKICSNSTSISCSAFEWFPDLPKSSEES